MKKIIFLLIPATIFFAACSNSNEEKHKPQFSSEAVKWNDSALSKYFYDNDSLTLVKKIALLDKATSIDSNFYVAYMNKLAFQNEAKQYKQALNTVMRIIRLSPQTPDY